MNKDISKIPDRKMKDYILEHKEEYKEFLDLTDGNGHLSQFYLLIKMDIPEEYRKDAEESIYW